MRSAAGIVPSVRTTRPHRYRCAVAFGRQVSAVHRRNAVGGEAAVALRALTQLTLFEREVSKSERETQLRRTVRAFLSEARQVYDYVFIDSAPGLSVVTESWLRQADFYLSPTRPDYISTRGLAFLRKFRQRNPEMAFAELLGVIINMKDEQLMGDEQIERWLRQDADNRCFRQSMLRVTPLQAAAYFSPHPRSYWAKYPGQTGDQLRHPTNELLGRLSDAQTKRR